MWTKIEIAKKALEYIPDDSYINLGIGVPTLVSEVLETNPRNITIHSENGVLGVGRRPRISDVSPTLINAGKETISIKPGASYFDSSISFGMIRGGHLDYCLLGGMQVDAAGSLANWKIPGKKLTGMGGAMDLVNGAKNIFVLMDHFNKKNESKLVGLCTLPLTGHQVVSKVFTNIGVFKPQGNKFKVIELCDEKYRKDLGDLFQ